MTGEIVGRRSAPIEHTLTAAEIRAYADAVGDPNPLYRDADAARRAGYPDIAAPPTAAAIFMMKPVLALLTDPELAVDLGRLVHGDQAYEFARPVVAGERLTVAGEVVEAYARAGHQFIVIATEARDGAGEAVVRGRATFVVRGGGER
ncbi:MAG: MaoC family dehydratase N-terminal domain-containing protein [Firmicutes bacterium]|nr:MaoC family dehydratase N-terminal domain-containing protein [Bacillota bacterium]